MLQGCKWRVGEEVRPPRAADSEEQSGKINILNKKIKRFFFVLNKFEITGSNIRKLNKL